MLRGEELNMGKGQDDLGCRDRGICRVAQGMIVGTALQGSAGITF